MKAKKPSRRVPAKIKERVLQEAQYQCAFCGHREGFNLTAHHIVPFDEDGPTELDNLIALCHNCHDRVHKDQIAGKDIKRLKKSLVLSRVTPIGVNALRFAYAHVHGVVAIPVTVNHLIDDKYLERSVIQMTWGTGDDCVIVTANYRITEKGKCLVRDWIGVPDPDFETTVDIQAGRNNIC